jgi:hypothetical protein
MTWRAVSARPCCDVPPSDFRVPHPRLVRGGERGAQRVGTLLACATAADVDGRVTSQLHLGIGTREKPHATVLNVGVVEREPACRGLHSSTFRLNVRTFQEVHWVVSVKKMAEVEERNGGVPCPCQHVQV